MRTYKNPILYADYSDPDVVRVGEDYYMVSSSFTYIPGVPLLHSRDLVHWELINHCVKKLPFEKYARPCHGSGTWAPSIRYHEGTFFVFIPLVDEGILVARSKDPYGEFEWNMLCESKGWIDPCPFWDDDGRAYMVFAYAKSRSGIKHRLSLVEIDPQCRSLLTEPRLIFDGEQIAPTSEGPKMYKRNGYYYILMPSGGVETGWQSCLRSRSVYGPYDYRVVMHQGNSRVNGPHQGGWVTSSISRMWWSWEESSTCSPCVFWMTGRSLARTRMGTVLESRLRSGPCRQENVLRENVLRENVLRENILQQNVLRENMLREIIRRENVRREKAPQEACRNMLSASLMILRKRHWGYSGSGRPIPMLDFIP